MINGHIQTSPWIRPEFCSCSPSLLIVLCLAEQKYKENHKSAHVCVIDTYNIQNGVYHVPNLIYVGLFTGERRLRPLWWVGGLMLYPEECLVHGVMSGPAFVALLYGKIRDDILKVCPAIRNTWTWGQDIRNARVDAKFPPIKISEKHVGLLMSISRRLNRPAPVYPLTVSLVCLVKRFDLGYNTEQLLESPGFAFYTKLLKPIIAHTDVTEKWLVNDLQWTG